MDLIDTLAFVSVLQVTIDNSDRAKHMAEQFAALGEFVQAFESVVFMCRSGIRTLSGSAQNHPALAMILEHKVMTAQPLLEIWRACLDMSLSALGKPEQKTAREVADQIAKDFSDLIRIRNELVHGTWFIGFGNEHTVDWSEFHAQKAKVTKTGLKYAELPKTAEELRSLSSRAAGVRDLLLSLSLWAVVPEAKFPRMFVNINGEWCSPEPSSPVEDLP